MKLSMFIIYLFLEMTMTFVMINSIKKMTNKIIDYNIPNIIYLIVMNIFMVLNNLLNYISIRTILAIILVILLNKKITKLAFKETIYYTIVYSIICIILELLSSVILSIWIKDINSLNNNITVKVVYSLFNCILIYLVFLNTQIIEIINKAKKLFNKYTNFYFVTLAIILILNIITIFRGIKLNNQSIIIISIISILYMAVTINIIINDKYNITILENKNKNLKDSYKAYAETIEEWRELKHNIKNDLYGLKTTLPKDKQTILNDLITKYNKNCEWINTIDNIPEGLQGLIYLKKNEARQQKVNLILDSVKIINTEIKDYIDLCDFVGILIDNAIDASKLTKHKIFEIAIEEKKKELKIRIINRFKNTIDLNKIGNKNYSTKEFKSGIGLNYLKKIKSTKIKVSYEIINDLFITNISYKQKINN